MKIKLLGKNLEELKRLVADEGLPGFTARQIAQWLYVKKVRSIDDMTNLSKTARAALPKIWWCAARRSIPPDRPMPTSNLRMFPSPIWVGATIWKISAFPCPGAARWVSLAPPAAFTN